MWTSLDIVKVAISIATPVIVLGVGAMLNQRLKRFEQRQWRSRKLIEKRIEIYDEIAPHLNDVYCFCNFVGHWKSLSPEAIVGRKRAADKIMFLYRYVFHDEVFNAYQTFIKATFREWNEAGHDARIRAEISGFNGDRRVDGDYDWLEDFDERFAAPEEVDLAAHRAAYEALMRALGASLGYEDGETTEAV